MRDVEVLDAVEGARSEIARSALDLVAVMELICETALALTGADVAAVDLVEDDDIVTCVVVGTIDAEKGLRLSRHGSLTGQCVAIGRPVHCVDAGLDPRVDFAAAAATGFQAGICVPLLEYDVPVGVLKVGSRRTHAFHKRDVAVLQLLAEVIAARLD